MTVEELAGRMFALFQVWTHERRPIAITASEDPTVAPLVLCSDGTLWEARFGPVQVSSTLLNEDGSYFDTFEGISGWIPQVPIPGTKAAMADPVVAWATHELEDGPAWGPGEVGEDGGNGGNGEGVPL